jgi:hypothetical protein
MGQIFLVFALFGPEFLARPLYSSACSKILFGAKVQYVPNVHIKSFVCMHIAPFSMHVHEPSLLHSSYVQTFPSLARQAIKHAHD